MLIIIVVLILFFDAAPSSCVAKFPCSCSNFIKLQTDGVEDTTSVKSDSIIKTRDTIHTGLTNNPTFSKVILQSIVGEVVFGGVFFGLKGNENLNGQNAKITPAYDPSIAFLAYPASAIAITVWGNAFSYGENNCWRPLLGGFGGFLIVGSLLGQLLGRTELGGYMVISTGFLAGEIAMYYLWPTDPEPSSNGSSSRLFIAPFISPQSSGVGLSYIIH